MWPRVMKNVIEACKQHNSKLVFIDNLYMYDPAKLSFMTEETPVNPSSKKGTTRAEISRMIIDEVNRKSRAGRGHKMNPRNTAVREHSNLKHE